LVALDSSYEWRQVGHREKQPYAIALESGAPMAMAGLWGRWRPPAQETVLSATIITCAPNARLAELHNRMPVILPKTAWSQWLGETPASPDELKAVLGPCPAEGLTMWRVDQRVGNVRNNDPSLIAPLPGLIP
jgi:putative SOS response-associated peptidase YedK